MVQLRVKTANIKAIQQCLVGICPGGGFSFISQVFPGSISDKEITRRSGILNHALWNPGEGLIADRGFTVKEYTDNLNIKLVIPAFLKGRKQLSEDEVIQTANCKWVNPC